MIVADSSAVVAALRKEPGWDVMDRHLDEAIVCAVNLIEIIDRMAREGYLLETAESRVDALKLKIEPLSESLARRAAAFLRAHRGNGLSLGDCACLATGALLGLPILTTDRDWGKLGLPLDIRVIR